MKSYGHLFVPFIIILCVIGCIGIRATAQTTVASDDFSSGSLSGGTGWANANAAWSTSDNALGGTTTVVSQEIKFYTPNTNGAIAAASRGVDLSSYASGYSVAVNFNLPAAIGGGDNFLFEMFDGSTWSSSTDLKGEGAGNKSYAVPASYLVSGFKIRFQLTKKGVDQVLVDTITVTASTATPTPTPTVAAGSSSCDPATKPTVTNATPGLMSMESHTFPTYFFVASYDRLHNFYDRNAQGARGGNQTDPDTDNFNKIIAMDSNLFPILTAVVGDYEFPNITGRNAMSWAPGALYSPSTNDYMNRGVAVAPDFITNYTLSFASLTTQCSGGNWVTSPTYTDNEIQQLGGRSYMQWAFVTDPGNSNLRRYEFQKLGGIYSSFNADDGTQLGALPGEDATSVCNHTEGAWYTGTTYDVLGAMEELNGDPDLTKCGQKPWQAISPDIDPTWCTGASDTCDATDTTTNPDGCYTNPELIWLCKHSGSAPTNITSASDIADYIAGDGAAAGDDYDPLVLPIQDYAAYTGGDYTFPLEICGNARDNSSDILTVGLNTGEGENRPTDHTNTANGSYAPSSDFYVLSGWEKMVNNTAVRDCQTFSITVNNSYDLSSEPGLQFRLRIYGMKSGSFVIDEITVGDNDSAFSVKFTGSESLLETRWTNVTSFLETVPPRSYPGYSEYTSPTLQNVGYGYATNTSFDTADNIRFRDPRNVDVYRDMFDTDNEGPVYIFVADTMNSRIQVFMNATGSAGRTNASFPIRPVRVKAPQDSAITQYKSNELGMRIHTGVNATAVAFGDGRPADWRQYTSVLGTTFANSGIASDDGRGEFFYPEGVAVDQDPDTRDVYVFVADTNNHRIQVFRDATGISFQPITDKRFDFEYEAGWGTYPKYTSAPGPYAFRYPKGLDVARFANNSSYLYVVDSKNYRLLKYLITENANGIANVDAVAGYGYNGSTFVKNLTTLPGEPLTAERSFEVNGAQAIGFQDPQDVATGYSGFYLYSAPNIGGYSYEVYTSSRTYGLRYLNDYRVYVTDEARNYTSVTNERLNMRVMQFLDYPWQNFTGVFLPWKTETVGFIKGGNLLQSPFGPYQGVYNSEGVTGSTGATENVPGVNGKYTDRPFGIAALTWDTVTPFDMRVMDMTTGTVYKDQDIIDNSTTLRVGILGRAFFGLPYTNITGFTNFTGEDTALDGGQTRQIHVFCYAPNGAYQDHTVLTESPFTFTPESVGGGSGKCTGYMKIVAEDKHFGYSGKTGTRIFRMK